MTVFKQYNPTTTQWETVLVGDRGPAGPAFNILGTLASPPPSASDGDAYIGAVDGHLYTWSTSTSSWVDKGQFVGATGPQGPTGPAGSWATAQDILSVPSSTSFYYGEAGYLYLCNSSSTIYLEVNSSTGLSAGQQIDIVREGTGEVEIVDGGGVTLNATPGLKLRARYSAATLKCVGSNTYILIGDLKA